MDVGLDELRGDPVSVTHHVRTDERGFTLPEVIVGMAVGMVVLLATLSLVDFSVKASSKTTNRVANTQRGRLAMEQMTQQLRSSVCLTNADASGTEWLTSASATSLTFYTSLAVATAANDYNPLPQKRVLTYANGSITQQVFTAASGTAPTVTFNASPSSTRVLATDVAPLSGQSGIFTYAGYATSGGTPTLALAAPLSAANLKKVASIGIAFRATARGGAQSADDIVYSNSVFLRASDATTINSPVCR